MESLFLGALKRCMIKRAKKALYVCFFTFLKQRQQGYNGITKSNVETDL